MLYYKPGYLKLQKEMQLLFFWPVTVVALTKNMKTQTTEMDRVAIVALRFSFICYPITTKLGMIVL